jgi:hypothetical protein
VKPGFWQRLHVPDYRGIGFLPGWDLDSFLESLITKGTKVHEGFRMVRLDLLSLQFSIQLRTGRGDVGEPALLALPDGAPREI